MIIENILESVGNTPLLNLTKLQKTPRATVLGKAEFLNPMGSVKERPALSIIENAEKTGKLKPGMTVIEATSGNTGLGLAMVAAVKGYKFLMIIENDVAEGICRIARALGTKTISTSSFIEAVALAKRLKCEDPDKYFIADQFNNPANPYIHSITTAQEIIKDTGKNLKAFVTSYGSGGTFTGIGKALKQFNPNIELILVEPNTLRRFSNGPLGCSQIHGVGPSFIPNNFDPNLIDRTISVSEAKAYKTVKLMASKLGILCGPSSGAMVHSALRVANDFKKNDIVVTMLPDRGERYFGTDFFPE